MLADRRQAPNQLGERRLGQPDDVRVGTIEGSPVVRARKACGLDHRW
jgi:hypothetical protein